jgi:hypothetical protein
MQRHCQPEGTGGDGTWLEPVSDDQHKNANANSAG